MKEKKITNFSEFSVMAQELGASDFFLTERKPIYALISKKLRPVSRPLTKRDFNNIIIEAFQGDGCFAQLSRREECDFTAYDISTGTRFRVNLAQASGIPFAVFRRLKSIDLMPVDLGIPECFLSSVTGTPYGLFLIVGTTGSGKSTTLASTLAYILKQSPRVVITIEDPIEYIIPEGQGIVFQREVGRDTKNFVSGIRAAMREKPDIILVGEIRDAETALAALACAETGHLVLATLHAKETTGVVERICGMFSSDRVAETKFRLTEMLVGVMAQALVRNTSDKLSLVWEFLEINDEVRTLLENGRRREIRQLMAKNRWRMVDVLEQLVSSGIVSKKTARSVANDLDEFKKVFGDDLEKS